MNALQVAYNKLKQQTPDVSGNPTSNQARHHTGSQPQHCISRGTAQGSLSLPARAEHSRTHWGPASAPSVSQQDLPLLNYPFPCQLGPSLQRYTVNYGPHQVKHSQRTAGNGLKHWNGMYRSGKIPCQQQGQTGQLLQPPGQSHPQEGRGRMQADMVE